MIKNVIFDIGGVLIDFRPEYVLKELHIDSPHYDQILAATVYNTVVWNEFDRGVLPESDVIAQMRECVPDDCKTDFDRFITEGLPMVVKPYEYADGWIKELKEKGYHVYLLSNYPKSLFKMHSEASFTFIQYVDGKIVSGYEKVVKPDAVIYNLLLSRYNLVANECVFIDDREKNVLGAEAAGIRGIQFLNYDDARRRLDAVLSST
ncbi:MAG: HAD family phosphatase [Treponema sp.]|nr:HAD family phosphatase [Treponema sp.]